jgi:carboxypeptidase Taq
VLKDAFQGLLGALHETGQALYDLGLPSEWVDQPVGQDRGNGNGGEPVAAARVHGGPKPRLRHVPPAAARKHYGAASPEWTEENLYRHLNRVARGTSRTDADELTYQTHIWMRYELERRLLSGELAVKELRDAGMRCPPIASGSSPRTTSRAACRTSTGRSDPSATSRRTASAP